MDIRPAHRRRRLPGRLYLLPERRSVLQRPDRQCGAAVHGPGPGTLEQGPVLPHTHRRLSSGGRHLRAAAKQGQAAPLPPLGHHAGGPGAHSGAAAGLRPRQLALPDLPGEHQLHLLNAVQHLPPGRAHPHGHHLLYQPCASGGHLPHQALQASRRSRRPPPFPGTHHDALFLCRGSRSLHGGCRALRRPLHLGRRHPAADNLCGPGPRRPHL